MSCWQESEEAIGHISKHLRDRGSLPHLSASLTAAPSDLSETVTLSALPVSLELEFGGSLAASLKSPAPPSLPILNLNTSPPPGRAAEHVTVAPVSAASGLVVRDWEVDADSEPTTLL